MTQLLVDGDIIAYRVGFAAEKRKFLVDEGGIQWEYPSRQAVAEEHPDEEPVETMEIQPISWVEDALISTMETMERMTKATSVKVFLTDVDITQNNRWKLATTAVYKGTRKGSKPIHHSLVRSLLLELYDTTVVSGVEADDALGIFQTDDSIIASIDKDLMMIPGAHYNITTREILHVSDPGMLSLERSGTGHPTLKGYGFKWFCALMLLGDRVDNIIGLKGIGPVKAFKMLKDMNDVAVMWKSVLKSYAEHSRTVTENAELLWISRGDHPTISSYLWEHIDGQV